MRSSGSGHSISKKKRSSNEIIPEVESNESRRMRGSYKCSKCGQPKKGHVCLDSPSQPSSPTPPPNDGPSPPPGFHPPPTGFHPLPTYDYVPPYVSPMSGEPNVMSHLMNIIGQLETQLKLLTRENTQLKNQLRWGESYNGEPNTGQYNSPTEQKTVKESLDYTNSENNALTNTLPVLTGLSGLSTLSGISAIPNIPNNIVFSHLPPGCYDPTLSLLPTQPKNEIPNNLEPHTNTTNQKSHFPTNTSPK